MTRMTEVADATVRVRSRGACAVIEFSNPPLNTSTSALRRQLLAAIEDVQRGAYTAAVLIGDHGTFISGSDVKEFSGPIAEPELPRILSVIERSAIPFVAALDGNALGGGLELALACDGRIASDGCRISLPEIEWGILPGAGGIQRLTRLIGKSRALDTILSGRALSSEKALELGIVDETSEAAELEPRAVELALRIAKRPLVNLEASTEDFEQLGAIIEEHRRAREGYPGLPEAITLTLAVGTEPAETGLIREREAFDRLRVSPAAAAFRHLRFGELRAGRSRGSAEGAPEITSVGVVGAGTMGAGIARLCAASGISTLITDLDLQRSAEVAADVPQLESAPLEGLADCDLVIESVVEELDVKRALFAELNRILPGSAVLATNTSYLDINAIAEPVTDRTRFLGLHFFNPAERMKLLEVIPGAQTSGPVLHAALRLARRLGKTSIVAGVSDGFVVNRLFAAYRRECEVMLQDGAYVDQIDSAMRGFGFKMGPFEVADLSGLDVAWSRRKRLAPLRAPTERYVDIPDQLCEAGRLGRKAGVGYYRYDSNSRARVDSEVTAIVLESSQRAGIVRRPFDADEIVGRVVAAITNEGALLLEDGIAERASDIDVASVLGFGFPRARGGPLWFSSQRETAEHDRQMTAVLRSSGTELRVGQNTTDLLKRLVNADSAR
ncbi:MAG: enoyl-CoA hydratase/isomerase family protein [Cryobacterium sp.]|nr:enoyl-CoA hydratase/isomerase family protein [Cryobacterium sp.]